MSKYQASSHVTYNIGYHVVFSTKYRYNLLRYSAATLLKELLTETSLQAGVNIRTMEVMPDHVHLFITAPPSLPVPDFVRKLKGRTSFILRRRFKYLRKYPSLWTRSFFVESVGHISEKTVVKYIENQKSALSSPG